MVLPVSSASDERRVMMSHRNCSNLLLEQLCKDFPLGEPAKLLLGLAYDIRAIRHVLVHSCSRHLCHQRPDFLFPQSRLSVLCQFALQCLLNLQHTEQWDQLVLIKRRQSDQECQGRSQPMH
jgi:hypothetical protein